MLAYVAIGDLGKRLGDAHRRLRPDLKASDFARMLGVSRQRLSNWERGEHDPPSDVLVRAADILGIPVAFFYTEGGLMSLTPGPTGKVKIVGTVGAGNRPNLQSEGEVLQVPIEFARADYSGAMAEGDSMMPYIHPGDVLIFKDFQQERLNRVFAAKVNDNPDALVKELRYINGDWQLASWNDRYEPILRRPVQLLGYLVGIIADSGALKIGPTEDGITRLYIENELRARLA